VKVSSPRVNPLEPLSPIASSRENNNEHKEFISPTHTPRQSSLEVEKFKNQLLERVQRSRQKSKRIGFSPVTYKELPFDQQMSPSSPRSLTSHEQLQFRIKSEPCIFDTNIKTFYSSLNTPTVTEHPSRGDVQQVKTTPRNYNFSQMSPRGSQATLKLWKNKSIESNATFLPYFKKPNFNRKKEKSKTSQPTWKKSTADFTDDTAAATKQFSKTQSDYFGGSLKLSTTVSAAGKLNSSSTKSFLNMNMVSLEAGFLSGIVMTEPSVSSRYALTPRK